MELNELMCGSTAAASAGYAVLSLGGFWKRRCLRAVSNPVDHSVLVAAAAGAIVAARSSLLPVDWSEWMDWIGTSQLVAQSQRGMQERAATGGL
jgi:hypothetical protein